MQEKLHKYMASCGVASRRKSEALILEGVVEVNGETITNLGYRIDPLQDVVKVKGKIIHLPKEKKYYMFFKPEGYLTTTHDPEGRPTIFDLLPELKGKVNPVGRLDKDTEGLLFLTNDGEFAFRLTHPKFEVKKTYRVIVQGELTPRAIHTLETLHFSLSGAGYLKTFQYQRYFFCRNRRSTYSGGVFLGHTCLRRKDAPL